MEQNQSLTKLSDLPILKHLEGGSGELRVLPQNAMANWKRGEKSIAWFVALGLGAGVLYVFFQFILPVLIAALSQLLAFLAVAGALIFAVMLAPFIYKLFRRIVRGLHKLLIKIDPFAELDDQLGKMKDSRQEFEKGKVEINACRVQMKQEAVKAEKLAKERSETILNVKGSTSPENFHKRLGKIMWNECGMARSEAGLTQAIKDIQALKKEFWSDVRVLGDGNGYNPELDKANRVADFIELGELMCVDALNRNESCGGHFREEYQTPEGEALRDDENYMHVSAWQYKGDSQWELHKEDLMYENIKIAQRSYK